MGQEQHDFFKVNSLTNLDKASPVEGTIVWDARRSLWNGAMLLGAIVLGSLTFSWSALAVFMITAGVTLCAGHSVGFHRRLIHRSFECPKWLERTLVWLGTAVGMGGRCGPFACTTAGIGGSASPTVIRSSRTAEASGWMACFISMAGFLNILRVLILAPELAMIPSICSRPHLDVARDSDRSRSVLAGGVALCRVGLFVRVAACTTMHWGVSYFAHTQGEQDWTVDGAVVQAHNVPLMAIPTMGESWHNNHHAFPGSARHGLYPGQIDLGWEFVRLLRALGLAWNVQVPASRPPSWNKPCPRPLAFSPRARPGGNFESPIMTTAAEALAAYYAANGIEANPARTATWICNIGPVSVEFPNWKWRRDAVTRHDLHHILTGYPCTMTERCRWRLGSLPPDATATGRRHCSAYPWR